MFNKKEINSDNWQSTIELTSLKAPKSKDIKTLVQEANTRGYHGVCLLHGDLRVAKKYRNENLKLITVAGFPPIMYYPVVSYKNYFLLLGNYTEFELEKVKDIIKEGYSDELDIIFPFYWWIKGRHKRIQWLINGIKKRYGKTLKVIIELGTILRRESDIKTVCEILKKCNYDFIKTNSGLIPQPTQISLPTMLRILSKYNKTPIKASGGIRRVSDIIALIKEFNIKRIGTSKVEE